MLWWMSRILQLVAFSELHTLRCLLDSGFIFYTSDFLREPVGSIERPQMASMEQAEIQPKTSASRHLLSPQNHPQNPHESSKNTSSFHVEKENPLEPFGGTPPTLIRAASVSI